MRLKQKIMNWNSILIKGSIVVLQIARLGAVLGFLIITSLTLLGNWDQAMSFELHSESNVAKERTDLLRVKDEYKNVVGTPMLVSSSYKFNLGFDRSYRIIFLVLFFLAMASYLYFLSALLKIIRSARNNEFFSKTNVILMRSIGFILIGLGLLSSIYGWVSHLTFNKYFESNILKETSLRIEFLPDVFGNTLFVGLIVLVIAQAFDHGLKLKQEQELTI